MLDFPSQKDACCRYRTHTGEARPTAWGGTLRCGPGAAASWTVVTGSAVTWAWLREMAGGLFRPPKGLWAQERLAVASRDIEPWAWGSCPCPFPVPPSSHQGGPGFPERGFLNFPFLESSVPGRADVRGAVGYGWSLRDSEPPGVFSPWHPASSRSRGTFQRSPPPTPPVPAHETTGQTLSEAPPPPLFPCFYFLERPRNLG